MTTILILGMHRSGTSALAGTLEEMGLDLGSVDVASPFNKKGHREVRRINKLQEAVLVHNGGNWRRPPKSIEWTDDHRKERDEIISSFAGRAFWGFKDPRTLFALDLWLEALPDLKLIGSFRNPYAVVRSLEERDKIMQKAMMTAVEGYQVWGTYNERLLDLQRKHGFAILDFDAPAESYLEAVRVAASDLGLPGARGPITFIDEELKHQPHAPPESEIPPAQLALHARILEVATPKRRS